MAWHCGAYDCPTHGNPGDRCPHAQRNRVWFCGRRRPMCPGHATPVDRAEQQCEERWGTIWSCGARACPGHPRRAEVCPRGPWYCGRTGPACNGHASAAAHDRHDRRAAKAWAELIPVLDGVRVARRIARLLRDPLLRRINYTSPAYPVSGTELAQAAAMYESGQVLVVRSAGRFRGSAAIAEYLPTENVLCLRRLPAGFADDRNLLHETVHLCQDAKRQMTGNLDAFEIEAAAYTVEMWYDFLKGQANTAAGPPFAQARACALSLANGVAFTSQAHQQFHQALLTSLRNEPDYVRVSRNAFRSSFNSAVTARRLGIPERRALDLGALLTLSMSPAPLPWR